MKLIWRTAKLLLLTVYGVCGLALIVFLVPSTGFQAKSIATGSMRPAIPVGSLVIIHKVPLNQLQVGNIVTYTKSVNPPVTITHRLFSKTTKNGIPYFVTKGDANAEPDPAIPGGAIIGRVILVAPGVGSVATFTKTPLGLVIIVVIPGLAIITDEIVRLRRTLRKGSGVKKNVAQTQMGKPAAPRQEPVQVQPPAAQPKPATKRSLDGMARRALVLLVGVLVLGVGSSLAQLQTNTVKISNISLKAGPTPTPTPTPLPLPQTTADCKNGGWQTFKLPDGSPLFKNQGQCIAFVNALDHGQCAEIHIATTGPGSTVVVVCRNHNSSGTTNNTTITITNSNNQSSSTGNTTGGSSGNASNGNTSSTNVNVSNL